MFETPRDQRSWRSILAHGHGYAGTPGLMSRSCSLGSPACEVLYPSVMDKTNAQAVVFKSLQIARLLDDIVELTRDADIAELVTQAYPFTGSLDEVSYRIGAWRDAMAETAGVAPASPRAFEVLAQQYRDWCVSSFGEENGVPVADDALASAKLAVVDVAFDDYAVGDYVLVWSRGTVHGSVGSQAQQRICAWPSGKPSTELLLDVQDQVRVVWERAR